VQKLKSFIVKKIEIVVSVLALLFITVLVAFLDKTGLFIVCFLTFIAFFVYAAYYYVVKFKFFAAVESENLLDFTVDSLTNLSSPMLMINTKDEIVWYNAAFEPIKKAIGLNNGQSVKGLVKDALCYDSMYGKKDVLRIRAEDKRYEVESVGFKLKGNVCLLSFWKDVTKQYNAEDMLKKRNLVVGYVAVDNADDVASYLQSQYRASIAVAYKELYDWVNGMHGVIREYDRDKYIVFVDEENFLPNFDKKFEILNAIETALTNSEVRLTFSMGFAHVDGTLAEKEANAREALDHAFQRGGAQVVVKTHNASKSFGGQSRAGVKTSKIKSRQTAEKLKALMAECENVIVMGHKRIDVDAFASACAVARFAMLQGKKVNIVINKNDNDIKVNIENAVYISSLNKDLKQLEERIKEEFKDLSYNDEPLLFNARQLGLLNKAKESLLSAKNEAENGQVIDIIAIDLQAAYGCILEILGKRNKEDLLDNIFSKFCLGK